MYTYDIYEHICIHTYTGRYSDDCIVLKCVAVCYSALQCVAVCCSVLQCVAVCIRTKMGRYFDD